MTQTLKAKINTNERSKIDYYQNFEIWSNEDFEELLKENNASTREVSIDCEQGNDEVYDYDFFETTVDNETKYIAVAKFNRNQAIYERVQEETKYFEDMYNLDSYECAEEIERIANNETSNEFDDYLESLTDEELDAFLLSNTYNKLDFDRNDAIKSAHALVERIASEIIETVDEEEESYNSFKDLIK